MYWSLRRRRLRLGDFLVRMWARLALRNLTFPLAVSLKRFAAPRWLFFFGMAFSLYIKAATNHFVMFSGGFPDNTYGCLAF